MANAETISLVVDKIVEAFDGDVELFDSWLTRSKLESEYAEIESNIRNAQDAQSADIDAYNEQIETLQAALNAKQAEIDNL